MLHAQSMKLLQALHYVCCFIILIAGGWKLSATTLLMFILIMCVLLSSSNKCEIVGHWPTMFSDDHDEDGFNQAHRVYGVSEKVRKQGKFSSSSRRVEQVFDLQSNEWITKMNSGKCVWAVSQMIPYSSILPIII